MLSVQTFNSLDHSLHSQRDGHAKHRTHARVPPYTGSLIREDLSEVGANDAIRKLAPEPCSHAYHTTPYTEVRAANSTSCDGCHKRGLAITAALLECKYQRIASSMAH